jgi:cyclic beta-1,2-glucan synthetase
MGASRATAPRCTPACTASAARRAPAAGRTRAPRKLTALLATQRDRAGGFGGGTAFLALPTGADERRGLDLRPPRVLRRRGRLVLPDHLGQRQPAPAWTPAPRCRAPGAARRRTAPSGLPAGPCRQPRRGAAAGGAPLRPPCRRAAPGRRARALGRLLGATEVQTPDPLFDAWSTAGCCTRRWPAGCGPRPASTRPAAPPAFATSCRMRWRWPGPRPSCCAKQILRVRARQFVEGDVQHWWHAPSGAGVRTHFSATTCCGCRMPPALPATTGDARCWTKVPFIEGPPVPEGAEDLYSTPPSAARSASVYEHAARTHRPQPGGGRARPAADGQRRLERRHEPRRQRRPGESVWLAWFLCRLVADFAPLARQRTRRPPNAPQRWDAAAQGWRAALQGPAWDGAWYRRAFFDDGSAAGCAAPMPRPHRPDRPGLGVLSGGAAGAAAQAMASARRHC